MARNAKETNTEEAALVTELADMGITATIDDCEHSGAYVVVPLDEGYALVTFGLMDENAIELGIYLGEYGAADEHEGQPPVYFTSPQADVAGWAAVKAEIGQRIAGAYLGGGNDDDIDSRNTDGSGGDDCCEECGRPDSECPGDCDDECGPCPVCGELPSYSGDGDGESGPSAGGYLYLDCNCEEEAAQEPHTLASRLGGFTDAELLAELMRRAQ